LETLKISTIVLKYCKNCDGMLIEEEDFEKLISYNVDPLSTFNPYYLRFIHDHPRDNRKKSHLHSCPICKEAMSIINYKKQSGVILDICEEHGIWLDGGELQQIIEWYAVGGDKKGREYNH
jgi:Zn-finger nucleic acid-binding protein